MKKYLLILCVALNIIQTFCSFTTDKSRFELNKKYSLFPPFDEDADKFWRFQNTFIPESKDRISLTLRQINDLGAVWNLIPTRPTTSWRAELQYTAYNDKTKIADGIAFWVVPSGSSNNKPAHDRYGGPNTNFTGLMIAIDNHKSPLSDYSLSRTDDQAAIIVVYNEKPRHYDWISEGNDIFSGRCLVKNRYRNTTKIISKLVVEYGNDELKVYHTNGTSHLKLCTTVKNLKIPSGYLIGLSASTGLDVGAYEVHSFRFYEDKEFVKNDPVPDPNPQMKLLTYFYIVSGLLIFVTLICFICSVHFLRQCLCKKMSKYLTQEPESKPISNDISKLEREHKNNPLDLMCQIQEISPPDLRIPLEPQRESNSYEDIEEKEDVYDILNWEKNNQSTNQPRYKKILLELNK